MQVEVSLKTRLSLQLKQLSSPLPEQVKHVFIEFNLLIIVLHNMLYIFLLKNLHKITMGI